MARPLRIEYPGALYHVTSRGDRREPIFEDDDDRIMFLELLCHVSERYNWVLYAYCLMTNHYHLLIETPDANLSKGMRQLNGVYTQRYNRIHHKFGHVFQGRFKAIHVQKDSYLLELSRYIVLNPVRAGMVYKAEEWLWSSYRATCGLDGGIECLSTDWLLSQFSADRTAAQESYQYFVTEGNRQASVWKHLKNQVFLGDDQFVEKLQRKLSPDEDLSEIPKAQSRATAQPLEYYANSYKRNEAIAHAYATGCYSMKQIGDYFGLHYSRVSRILKSINKT